MFSQTQQFSPQKAFHSNQLDPGVLLQNHPRDLCQGLQGQLLRLEEKHNVAFFAKSSQTERMALLISPAKVIFALQACLTKSTDAEICSCVQGDPLLFLID